MNNEQTIEVIRNGKISNEQLMINLEADQIILSIGEINRLGDRLRQDTINKDDLSLLDEFRKTFSDIDEQTYPIIQGALKKRRNYTLTMRKRKTQQSIVAKLKREHRLRLSQMQDIAGCRIVVQGGSIACQQINDLLSHAFSSSQWEFKSKTRSTGGYHAIHVIVKTDQKCYEIQLRTYAQDIWANLTENQCDESNSLKYGGSEQEQSLMNTLRDLAERFYALDENAHEVSFLEYEQKIEEAIRHVLSD